MVQPVIIVDYERKTVTTVGGDPTLEKDLADALASQRELVTTSAGTPPRATDDD